MAFFKIKFTNLLKTKINEKKERSILRNFEGRYDVQENYILQLLKLRFLCLFLSKTIHIDLTDLFKRSTIYFKVKYYQQALSSFHLHSLYQRIFFFSFTRFLFPNTVWILTNRLVYINTHYVKFLKFHFFFSASNFITKDITARINTFLFPIVRVSQRCHLGTLKTFFSIHLGECSLS